MMDLQGVWDRIWHALSQVPWGPILVFIEKLGTFLLGAAGVWGVVRTIPRLLNHAKVMQELIDEREERKRAENAARDYREAAERSSKTAETYQRLFDATHAEAAELRAEMAQERIEREEERKERDESKKLFTVALLYLVDVIGHFKENGLFSKMPTIPDELQQGIATAMAERARKLQEAPKSEPGFCVAPEDGAN